MLADSFKIRRKQAYKKRIHVMGEEIKVLKILASLGMEPGSPTCSSNWDLFFPT